MHSYGRLGRVLVTNGFSHWRNFEYLSVLCSALLFLLSGALLFLDGIELCGAFVLEDRVAGLHCPHLAHLVLLERIAVGLLER